MGIKARTGIDQISIEVWIQIEREIQIQIQI